MLAQAKIVARLCALEAFCQQCPASDEVTAFLATLGFLLILELPHKNYAKRGKLTLPPMPAQYHYRDCDETELIFLAGQDHPEQGVVFPIHTSRWWLYPGISQYSYHAAMQALCAKWELNWTILVH